MAQASAAPGMPAAPGGSGVNGENGNQPQPSQAAWRKHHTVFTNEKAGMAGVDREHVQKVVFDMSKDSAHFKNEQRKQAQTEERIARLKKQAAGLTQGQLAGHQRAMDAVVAQLAATRDLRATWLVVDQDAFFASCAELLDPSLKDKPFAVGGIGMISTANYMARRYGVRSAMPGFIGRRLCPELIFVESNFQQYVEVSNQTRGIFRDYDPDMQAGSLDEAYLDVTAYCAEHGMSGEEVAETVRRRVREETGVTCSVGIAPNRMLAKVCADRNKPDGQFMIPANVDAVSRFVAELPIRKVPGIGKVTEHLLKSFGVETCSQLIEQRALLSALFSKVAVDYFMRVGLGLGQTAHGEGTPEGEVGRKGISCERTFAAISTTADLEAKCAEIAEHLAGDMAREQLRGRTVTLKLKSATTFEVHTRAVTLPNYVSSAEDLCKAAVRLMRPELPLTLRLMGIRVSAFKERPAPAPGQKTLAGFVRISESAQPATDGSIGGGGGGDGGAAEQPDAADPAADDAPVASQPADGSLPAGDGAAGGSGSGAAAGDGGGSGTRTYYGSGGFGMADGGDSFRMDGGHNNSFCIGGGRACVGGDGGAAPRELKLEDLDGDVDPEAEESGGEAAGVELSLRDWQASNGAAEPHSSQPAGKAQRTASWRCSTCTYINPRHLLRCELCEVPRRGPLSCDFSSFGGSGLGGSSWGTGCGGGGSGGGGNSSGDPGGSSGDGGRPSPSQQHQAAAAPAQERQHISRFFEEAHPATASLAAPHVAQPEPAAAAGGAAAAADEQPKPWRCDACGKAVPEAQRAEHSDWHFADDLQRQGGPGAAASLEGLASQQQPGKRRKLLASPARSGGGSGLSGGSAGGAGKGSGSGGRAGQKIPKHRRQQQPATIDALLSRHKQKSS